MERVAEELTILLSNPVVTDMTADVIMMKYLQSNEFKWLENDQVIEKVWMKV